MKKTSYNNKTRPELHSELATLRATVYKASGGSRESKNTAVYRTARKNVARALTALNALPASETQSTNVEK